MKKLGLKICVALAFFLFFSLFVGCAKTGDGDIFRFEVRELELTVGDTRNLKLVLGDQSEDAEICFIISEVGSDPFDSSNSSVPNVISLEEQSIHSGESVKVTAEGEGEVYLTAYVKDNQNINDTIVVTISKEKLTAMTAIPTKDVLYISETAQFTVTTYPNTISNAVIYSSSDENVGTISETGLFTALNVGTTVITITSVYDETIVAVKEMTVIYNNTVDVVVEKAEVELLYKDEYQIVANVLPNEYPALANPLLTYEVKVDEEKPNAKVVTVDQNGLVTAIGVGEAIIIVSSVDGISKEIKFNVTYAEATSISVMNEETVLENNGTLEINSTTTKVTLKIAVLPENAEQTYTCTVSENEAITVTEQGVITVKATGTAVITITSGDLTFTLNVVVTESVE